MTIIIKTATHCNHNIWQSNCNMILFADRAALDQTIQTHSHTECHKLHTSTSS